MNREILIIIGAGKHQTSLIKEARKMGYSVFAVDINPKAEGFAFADYSLVHSAYDAKGILSYLKNHFDRNEIVGVMTQAARGTILSASIIARSLHLPGLSVESAKLFASKIKSMRKFNSKYKPTVYDNLVGISTPPSFPLVIKTENSSGSSGIFVISSIKELERFRKTSLVKGPILVEPFMEGRHLGVIGMTHSHEPMFYGVIEKFLNPDRTIDYSVFPAQITEEENRILRQFTLEILRKSKFDFGPFQLEIILQPDDNIYFVEMEASVLGSYISEYMIPQAGANNFIRDAIGLAVEEYLNTELKGNEYICVNQYYYPPKTGILKSFNLNVKRPNTQFLPYLSAGEKIVDTRMYVANALFCFKTAQGAKVYPDFLELEIEVEDETK